MGTEYDSSTHDGKSGGCKSEIATWFKKGQESILRKNKSGCCCVIDDDNEIVLVCGAHQEWLERHLSADSVDGEEPCTCERLPIRLSCNRCGGLIPVMVPRCLNVRETK